MGGAFGGKESQATIIAGIAAVLAWKARRPVKLRLPRDDDMRATGKRHPFLIRYDVGFDGEGHILALDLTLAANGGNVADHTPAVLTRALCHADNCYFLPNVRFRGLPCKTNTVSNTAFRGYGGPQGMLAIETIIEVVARQLGLPVDTVRRRNFYGIGRNDVTPYGMTVEDNIIERVVDELDRAVDLAAWRRDIVNFNRQSPVVKKGLATMPIKFGISFNRPGAQPGRRARPRLYRRQRGAQPRRHRDGAGPVHQGGAGGGGGVRDRSRPHPGVGDQHRARCRTRRRRRRPRAPISTAWRRSMPAEQIKARMTEVAADHFGVPAGEIVFDFEPRLLPATAASRSPSWRRCRGRSGCRCRPRASTARPKIHWDFATNTGRPFYYFVYGAAAAEVAIDTLTGELRVLRAELVQDCGRSLNPAIDLGQIEGAFVQGMGWLTTEELWWDADGRLRTHGPSTYKIPGSRDVPPVFNARMLARCARTARRRSSAPRPIGEPPLMLAISVWLAISDAIASLADHRAARRASTRRRRRSACWRRSRSCACARRVKTTGDRRV